MATSLPNKAHSFATDDSNNTRSYLHPDSAHFIDNRLSRRQKLRMQRLLYDLRKEQLHMEQHGLFEKECKYKTGLPTIHSKVTDQKFLDTSDYSGKYWRSVPNRSAMTERITDYFTEEPMFWKTDVRATAARTLVEREILLPRKVIPLSLRKAYESLPRDTSPGFPYSRFTDYKKRDIKGPTVEYCQRVINHTKHGWKDFRFPPCELASRLALCEVPKNKPRAVWVYPICVSLFEAVFSVPLAAAMKGNPLFAWHVNWLGGAGPFLFKETHDGIGATLGKDFSHLDRSLIDKAINWAFSVLRKNVMFTKPWHPRLWHAVKKYFINTHILAYGKHYRTEHGVPSGSGFTQLIDTLVTAYLMVDTCLYLATIRGGPALLNLDKEGRCTLLSQFCRLAKFLGDDSLIKLLFGLLAEDNKRISEYLKLRHNMEAHPEKGFFCATGIPDYAAAGNGDSFLPDEDHATPQTTEFLGKALISSQVMVISTDLVKAQVYIPEHIDQTPGDVLTRLVGVAWSCGTSVKHYDWLLSKWNEIKKKYPKSVPVPWGKNERRYFKYVEGMEKMPPNVFPSHNEIFERYVQSRKPLKQLRREKGNLIPIQWNVDLRIDSIVQRAVLVRTA